jgi:thiamine biosynthesis lipoprotein
MSPTTKMTDRRMGRRRALAAIAAASALPLSALAARPREAPRPVRWDGVALGAPAHIVLYHPDRRRAEDTLAACCGEIARLERAFSLYRPDSELVALNRDGRIDGPSHDLVALLAEAQRFAALSAGRFDVTVQPLWWLYADHFAAAGADPRGPDARRIAGAASRVDCRALDIGPAAIRFARPGMAVTLNGIAQGAITDRIAELLRDAGFDSVLVDLGELRALGPRPDGPWHIGIEDARRPGRSSHEVPLSRGGIAGSGGYGARFEPSGRFHHLFDPATGTSAHGCLSVTVFASRAMVADAAATALAVAGPLDAKRLLASFGAEAAEFMLADGTRLRV